MKSNVRILGNSQFQHPDAVLEVAKDANLDYVMILGWTADGDLYVGGSDGDLKEFLYIVEIAKREMIDRAVSPEDAA